MFFSGVMEDLDLIFYQLVLTIRNSNSKLTIQPNNLCNTNQEIREIVAQRGSNLLDQVFFQVFGWESKLYITQIYFKRCFSIFVEFELSLLFLSAAQQSSSLCTDDPWYNKSIITPLPACASVVPLNSPHHCIAPPRCVTWSLGGCTLQDF